MNEATIALTVMSALILLVFVGLIVWGIKSGQFKNVEEAKFQIFREPGKADAGQTGNEKNDSAREVKRNAT